MRSELTILAVGCAALAAVPAADSFAPPNGGQHRRRRAAHLRQSDDAHARLALLSPSSFASLSGRTFSSSSSSPSARRLFDRVQVVTKEDEETTTEEGHRRSRDVPTNGLISNPLGDLMTISSIGRDEGVDEAWELVDMEAAEAAAADGDGGPSAAAVIGMIVAAIVAAAVTASSLGIVGDFSLPSISGMTMATERFFEDPNASLQAVVKSVEAMGPNGYLYFGIIYTVAEILAIPAIPLTASAGYLFGVTEGTAVVLTAASIAAAVSFVIGRTLLRSYVEGVLEDFPKFKKIDKAIGREGFKLMLLLRLSPVFPFALSNYLYGATSIGFWPYFFGTMLGFLPGTIAYVYTGEIGKALTVDAATAEPWYVYAGGLALFSGLLKIVADVATGIIDDLEDEDDE